MRADYISHTGAVRKNNEDAIYCDPKAGVFVVADGIGGKEAGEVASATAVRIVAEKLWEDSDEPAEDRLREAFYEANHVLFENGKKPKMAGMGTTLTAAVCGEKGISIVHVGDSRAYLIHNRQIRQLTEDHSLVAAMQRQGKLTAEEAKHHPRKNILLRALGQDPRIEVDMLEAEWEKGDYLLLCTDGLYNLVEEEEMQEAILRTVELRTAIMFLAEAAYLRGGYDNISLIAVAHD